LTISFIYTFEILRITLSALQRIPIKVKIFSNKIDKERQFERKGGL